ncbi:MAG: 50S ribosomal protein L32 [Armatimonadota bacterium]|nr:50S ribosomal protein L32 [bacterium]MCS7309792.1 50S ribosomal protein L32 [Armatimonadota bacterium]MDW8105308.1 50S ribosomal protein L32 [Armatimonadota bacterium]MDW8289838.1 50S ribosomal protein L32 [Armatimonadota bacterium]
MALPKRRHSHARTAKRRTHYTLNAATVVKIGRCPTNNPDCPGAHLSHTACPVCGYYKGRQAVLVKRKRRETR